MTTQFWQAKIWGLLHDPPLKALRPANYLGDEGAWQSLVCMQGWVSPKDSAKHSDTSLNSTWLKHVGLCDLIAAASDRTTIGRLPPERSAVVYGQDGIEIRHLLSGRSHKLKIEPWHQQLTQPKQIDFIRGIEQDAIPAEIRDCKDARKVFWWLWRCYPQVLAQQSEEIALLPAETRLPDASLWSHTSMTAALAGALAGYYNDPNSYPEKGKSFERSRPYLGTFTFTPVQELIKASRKMRDFWAGSWLLHYLSAKVCWDIAWKYGPDTFLYPCLYAQPLIDYWLLNTYTDFKEWIARPSEQALLTAGFPNVLVMILPDNGLQQTAKGNPVYAAMQQAAASLEQEWSRLGQEVRQELASHPAWQQIPPSLWDGWLKSQWQHYWAALPLGDRSAELHQSPRDNQGYKTWKDQQNRFAQPQENLLLSEEQRFVEVIFNLNPDENTADDKSVNYWSKQPNLNVGSWWASIFDRLRFNLTAVKNARTWELPTAFGPRSTISGIGPVVHPVYDPAHPDWATEGETKKFWANHLGMFDGIEELNATEVLKRGLHKILSKAIFAKTPGGWREALYAPDLSSGVAGWLRQMEQTGNQDAINYYSQKCKAVSERFDWTKQASKIDWGIPWIADHHPEWKNPRLLNAGWLIDDFKADDFETTDEEERKQELKDLREFISGHCFANGNNPTDWYVLAAGDGDGMNEWLKGSKLESYEHYIPEALRDRLEKLPDALREPFVEFLKVKKRMGPATHSALSRALLDFSNQLVPYLTEKRYAGRLIYGGGDDVLAYSNLWEWDNWLWDIRQCFKGADDPQQNRSESNESFAKQGDYWQWQGDNQTLPKRPLFTMGSAASISFGIVIAHHSTPLAIALEHLWEAEANAKKHKYVDADGKSHLKDAVQVKVIYGNGNILKATSKFDVFNQWKSLLTSDLDPAIFEQAAEVWKQHPAPQAAIEAWTRAFCTRRDALSQNETLQLQFQQQLANFLTELVQKTTPEQQDQEVANWLKLAAFVLRKRDIKLGGN